MDFWLSDDERDLQDGIRSFLRGRFPIDVVREREEHAEGVIDLARWRELADTGVFTIATDMGMRAAALVFEELGRALVAGPLVATAMATPWLSGAASGDIVVAALEADDDPVLVDHPGQAQQFLMLTDAGVSLVPATELHMRTVPMPLDTLTPVAIVDRPLPAGTLVAGPDDAARVRRDAVVLTSALLMGVALGATELSQQYAIEREQFGRPIGSFQAVKHLLADMLTKAEVARSAVYAAACAIDGASDDDAERAASVAKVMAGEAALFCGKSGIQVHGGMGFTWEVHAQRFWKRAVALDNSFGIIDHHAALLAASL